MLIKAGCHARPAARGWALTQLHHARHGGRVLGDGPHQLPPRLLKQLHLWEARKHRAGRHSGQGSGDAGACAAQACLAQAPRTAVAPVQWRAAPTAAPTWCPGSRCRSPMMAQAKPAADLQRARPSGRGWVWRGQQRRRRRRRSARQPGVPHANPACLSSKPLSPSKSSPAAGPAGAGASELATGCGDIRRLGRQAAALRVGRAIAVRQARQQAAGRALGVGRTLLAACSTATPAICGAASCPNPAGDDALRDRAACGTLSAAGR